MDSRSEIHGTHRIQFDYRRNHDVLEECKVDPVETKLVQSKQKWLNHVNSIENIRYPHPKKNP
jgi:hypothetical protein